VKQRVAVQWVLVVDHIWAVRHALEDLRRRTAERGAERDGVHNST
jgi:hypothetical protein